MRAELIDVMGDDLRVVNAARVSFNKESDYEYGEYCEQCNDHHGPYLSEKDKKLIKYLANHGHWTPFSHPQVTIRETVPIFVARQRFKHMVGFTYNEVSRRYVDDPPEFYVPDEWRSRPDGSMKQGSGSDVIEYLHYKEFETIFGEGTKLIDAKINIKEAYETFINQASRLYNLMLENNVSPEQARMVLPQSMYTSYYTTGSLAAWARAYKQRIDGHSQKEIQDLAKQWDTIIQPLFPVSWSALTE